MIGTIGQKSKIILSITQIITTLFCGLFVTVYLLGLRDLPENVVYHSQPAVRNILSIVGILSLILILIVIILSFLKNK